MGSGVLWKILVTPHSPPLHQEMQTEIVLCKCNKLEICLSLRWDLNPDLSLLQIIAKQTYYHSAKGHSQGQ